MGFCQKFKVPLVLCDEIFYLEDTRTFDAGQPIDEGATVSGTVTLNVTECDIVVVDNLITANLEITVQKELTVNQEDPFELEFMYHINQTVTFRGCTAADLPPTVSPEDLQCQILRLEFDETVTTDPEADTITDELTILVKIKVEAIQQVFLSL